MYGLKKFYKTPIFYICGILNLLISTFLIITLPILTWTPLELISVKNVSNEPSITNLFNVINLFIYGQCITYYQKTSSTCTIPNNIFQLFAINVNAKSIEELSFYNPIILFLLIGAEITTFIYISITIYTFQNCRKKWIIISTIASLLIFVELLAELILIHISSNLFQTFKAPNLLLHFTFSRGYHLFVCQFIFSIILVLISVRWYFEGKK